MKDDPERTEQFKRENRMAQMAKLRIPWKAMGEMANIERALAAGTIQDLMDEIEAWRQAMQKAERDIAALRDQLEVEENAVNHLHTDRNNLRLEVERLRAERDEARRELCYWWDYSERRWKFPNGHKFRPTAVEWADITGWDCFKEKP